MAGNRIVNLGSMASAVTTRMQQALYGMPNQSGELAIRTIPSNAWPNPLQPIPPYGPKGSKPFAFSFWEGQNLNYTPRPDAEYTASELRQLSTYTLARMCIKNVKDIVCNTEWQIGLKPIPGETQRERAQRQKGDSNIVKLHRFFEYPDGEQDWPTWSRILIENLLTIDAGCVLIERGKGGKVARLRPILDGASVTRYIDERGLTPQPPNIAYTQSWNGLPRTDLTTDELMYAVHNIVPRNTISSYLYGMSATESIAQDIKIGIERLNFILAYYTSGSIPDIIQMVPPGIDAEKVRETMASNNAILSGNLQRRRQWTCLQGFHADGKNDQILFPKEPLLADAFDDTHIRKVAYAYGVSSQRLQKQMNRSSSESGQTAAEEEGISPWAIWLQNAINRIIQFHMGMDDYELTMNLNRESDIMKIANTDILYVKNGMYTINERREIKGDDPRPEAQADELATITNTGWVKLGDNPFQPAGAGGDGPAAKAEHADNMLRMVPRNQ